MPKNAQHIVTVFIVDANRLKTELMIAALERARPQIEVLGSTLDSFGVREALREKRSDVVVISAELKEGTAANLEVVRELRASYPSIRIVMQVENAANRIVEAFRAGTDGVISRYDSFEVLCKCIHAVHEGQVWANSEQLHFVIDALAKSAPPTKANGVGAKLLTQREEGLVQLVSQGLTNRDIAQQLHLSEHTVRNYLFRIFNKVGTSTRLELALYGIHRVEEPPMPSSSDRGSCEEAVSNSVVPQSRWEAHRRPSMHSCSYRQKRR